MQNHRETKTNAADSAPGVGDGPTSKHAAQVPYHPKGRKAAWILLAGIIALVVIVMVAKPEGTSRSDPTPAVAPDIATQGDGPEAAPTAQAGGPAGQTPSLNQPGGVGEVEVYPAPGKTPGASEDNPR